MVVIILIVTITQTFHTMLHEGATSDPVNSTVKGIPHITLMPTSLGPLTNN